MSLPQHCPWSEKIKAGRKSKIRYMDSPPLCQDCGIKSSAHANHQGKTYFRKWCHSCMDKRYKTPEKTKMYARISSERTHEKFRQRKMKPCEICGFMPKDACQMDWDHINGTHFDERPENLQLLCANCHRLKSKENGDFATSAFPDQITVS